MEKEFRKLNDIKGQMEKGLINFKKSPKERITYNYIETRLEILEAQLKNFSAKYEGIIGECENEDLLNYFQEDIYERVFEIYLTYKVELKNALSQSKSDSSSKDNCEAKSDSVVRLPKIVLPTFSGKYTEWSSFRDLFISLVHNNKRLDDVQRLHYLKTQLSGEAEQLIRHVPITESNYKKCWELLEHRFNNKKFMSTCILKRLFSQRNIVVESSSALKDLLDVTSDCLHELTNLGIDVSSWDIIIIYIISLKLDIESRKQWELHVSQSTDDLPSFKQFREFLETRFRALEFVEPKGKLKTVHPPFTSNAKVMHNTINVSCPHCSESHKLVNCKQFAKEDSEKRRVIVQSLGVCFNCLGSHHTSKSCRVLSKCRICQRKHHTLLHPKSPSVTSAVATPVEPTTSHEGISETPTQELSSNIAAHFVNGRVQGQVLLATALIRVESQNGSSQILRALLDQGSQASFITEAGAQLLRLKKVVSRTTITGIGGHHGDIVSRHVVKMNIQSLHDPSFSLEVTAHVLSSLTSVMPDTKFQIHDWPEIQNIGLADPRFNVPNKIDILLGAETYCRVLKAGLIKSPLGSPIAQDTHLGWIVSGKVSRVDSSLVSHNTVIAMHTQVEENEMLKRLWELDSEPALDRKPFTPEEQACENFYATTTKRDIDGRYVVKLPFRSKDPICKYSHSKNIAVKRLLGLERKLARDEKLKQQYSEVINEYLLLGHLEKINDESDKNTDGAVYLPHHAVVRQDKLTTKVRVVYDASCKGTNGVSLNDTLMVGPTLQADLRHIVMRWRQHPICLAADIEKMYRQIKVARPDTDFQRIVWREDPSKEIEDFRLLTVTFGTSCAPYLAVKTLHQVACDEGEIYPLAADRVMTDFYMDDLMTGCQSETEVIQIYKEMNSLLGKGGFRLQKWTSNKMSLLEELNEASGKDLEIKMDKVTKILGLTWNRNTDEFDYSVKMSPTAAPETKRTVISEISRLYDPLGWIAPCIITAKVLIQKLWIAGISWDDELPSGLQEEWRQYRTDLDKLVNFHIPRWIGKAESNVAIELHGFSDASNVAYAAVVYCRIISSDGDIHSHLITAKTKVAPIKQLSIPRLELCGSVLVAKLLIEVAEVMHIPKANIHAWTDSSVVLAWLSDHPSRWKTYVANRTSKILSLLDNTQWAHVQSKDNPADIASRGAPSEVLLESDLWKRGPSWLRTEPVEYTRPNAIRTKEERKVVKVHTVNLESDFDITWGSRFSSLRKLMRVMAYCKRFLLSIKRRKDNIKVTPYLSVAELREALDHCIRQSQQQCFHNEYVALKNNAQLDKRSPLYKFNVFIDKSEILRVGGRLRNSSLSDDTKHPVIISHDSCLARLIVADAHEMTFHGGQQLMLNFIRTRYWITRVKGMVRAHIRSCIPCIRYAATTKHQLMGELPVSRVTPSKPFLNSGVDYAGPINMRVSKGRGQRSYKGYICLFICMATRAVHIEAVSDLTSEGFLAAFKRFVARRGHCRNIWSDNGTNFVGAAKELRTHFAQEGSLFKDIASALASSHTEWHFIPPHSPNFGGLWEAGIKSVKHHLKRVVGDSTLTFEEMCTVLSQIEACLNSRPLSQSNSDPEDPTPLTPGHFLVGQPLIVPPDCNYEDATMSTLRRWQLVQRMVQNFWRRWQQEYLTHFFHRYKWASRIPDFKVGDVVLVKEDNLPPARWLYGKVVQLHPGKDNLTRVVTIRCKGTEIKRPTSKLCLLPVTE
ncbi:uncharacterized protein LOC142977620 [Anticarsia gemmatalis]|uniref:uncharacterized protein LOC142977620 n=1 Tax=Anticarsia gemmatalis TaxID=129554 RepID=UPI003F77540A